MDKNIKNWYRNSYPQDDLGYEISPTATFNDLFDALDNYQDVYEVLGVNDSTVRTRAFAELASIMGVPYQEVYAQWTLA